jgi:hypothetical protein
MTIFASTSSLLSEAIKRWKSSFHTQLDLTVGEQRTNTDGDANQLSNLCLVGTHSPNAVASLAGVIETPLGTTGMPPLVRVGSLSFHASGLNVPLALPLRDSRLLVIGLDDPSDSSAVFDSILIRTLLSLPPLLCRVSVFGTSEIGAPSAAFDILSAQIFRRLATYKSRAIEDFLDRNTGGSVQMVGQSALHVVCLPNFPEGLSSRDAELILSLATSHGQGNMVLLVSVRPEALDDPSSRSMYGLASVLRQYPILYANRLAFRNQFVPRRNDVEVHLDHLESTHLAKLVGHIRDVHERFINENTKSANKTCVWLSVERATGSALMARVGNALAEHPWSERFFVFHRTEPIRVDFDKSNFDLSLLCTALPQVANLLDRFSVGTFTIQQSEGSEQVASGIRMDSVSIENLSLLLTVEVIAGRLCVDLAGAMRIKPSLQYSEEEIAEKIQKLQEGTNTQVLRNIEAGRAFVMSALEQILSTSKRTRPNRILI